MRWAVVGILILASAAACSAPPTTPAAVQPTLAAIETLGLRCGDGVKDNVPSGLFQWSCSGAMEAVKATVLVDGNDEGVAGFTLVFQDLSDPAIARDRFGKLVDAVPPLSTAPVLKDLVAGWAGGQQDWTAGGVHISALCNATQCIVTVLPSRDPLRPLPLP
jgi:hypothetical protein